MVDETRNLKHQAREGAPSAGAPNYELGESLTPAEAEQHIQDAAIANEQQIQEAAVKSIHEVQEQAKQAIEQAANSAAPEPAAAPATFAKSGSGALSMLNASPSAAAAPQAAPQEAPQQNLAATEKEELNRLLNQEHIVDRTEKTAIAEVNQLAKNLS